MKLKERYISLILFLGFFVSTNGYCHQFQKHTIAMVGTGYVGLVTGVSLASFGHHVVCIDIDADKIERLQKGIIPIYEFGLEAVVKQNIVAKRLYFTSDVDSGISQADIIFIAVGTPIKNEGECDLSYLKQVVATVAPHLVSSHKIIVIKSTVPIGTAEWMRSELIDNYHLSPDNFDIISNPEFLREGTALYDTLNPDRIVIGYSNQKAFDVLCMVYHPLLEKNVPVVATNFATAEAIKYASNSFLAVKIGFINEMANICLATQGNITKVSEGMGLDPSIGPRFLKPGPGFGGSCLPKDVQVLVNIAKKHEIPIPILEAIMTSNAIQQQKAFEFVSKALKHNLSGKVVTLLGLSFKANTDDIRFSPAIPTIKRLLESNVVVKAYDPVAMENMQRILPSVEYCSSIEEACVGSDAVVILTEWDFFKRIDWGVLASHMRRRVVIDMRGVVSEETLRGLQFERYGINRS